MEKSVKKIVDDLSTLLKKSVPQNQGAAAHDFVQHFYTNPAKETLTRMSQSDIVEGLERLWSFFYERKAGEPKIRVYHWKPKANNALAERIIIDIVNDNMSFSLDSLYGLLQRLGTKARLTFHPILAVERNKKGEVQSVSGPTNVGEKQSLEYIIHCEIVDLVSPELMAELNASLPNMLRDVRWANEDWKPMREKALETVQELKTYEEKGFLNSSLEEVIKFVEWIEDEHYTFLGYCNYDLVDDEPDNIAHRVKTESPLGVLRDEEISKLQTLFSGIALSGDTKKYIFDSFPIIINKTSCLSHVHRNVRMDCVGIRRYNDQGKVIGIRLFVGLFTSVAYDSSARDIPLLRTKISKIIKRAGFTYDWHDGKALIHILDSLPRDELFQASIKELTDIGLEILRLQERRRLAFFVRRDQFNRFLSCLVYIPRDRFDSDLCDRIATILSSEFEGTIANYKAQYGELAFARVHYTVHSTTGLKDHYDIDRIEALLVEESRTWTDDLKFALMERYHEVQSAYLYRRYRKAFDRGYQDRQKGPAVLEDLIEIEEVYENDPFRVRIYSAQDKSSTALKLKIYNRSIPLPLSDVLPILENLDLKVVSEVPYTVSPLGEEESVWIHDFTLESRGSCLIDVEKACKKFEDTLIKVRNRDIENDGFNRLVLRANLNWWQCILFRAYAKYLRLIGTPFSKAYISNTLVKNPTVVALLAKLFEERFHPSKAHGCEELIEEIKSHLDGISNADEDRILRLYLTVITATIRTNAYQHDHAGNPKNYLSFKISSRDIEELPKPRPLYEVFVYSSYMEGIHLRGGKVARGGIRWSDRQEDFRTEVLSLVKAQMVKNTVIVPVGSKGGFIVKKSLEGKSRDEFFQEGIRCYQNFIRGLLDITDNLVGDEVVAPQDVKRWDGDDTYLVVAADKGTATFSDFANEISKEYNFWLGDAFASGGSVGYDHKKMGITARGAWTAVQRHFRELGKNIQKEPVTVIGIGDMSGDVFGNGMLLSKTIELVAAFNHLHIFIDPTPNAAESFKERKRLFNLPRSTWDDYDRKVLSKDAEIYSRSAKTLTLNPTIQEMFGLESSQIRPDDLIKTILKYQADLLWFGGIGTYIKSASESHGDVGDRANDNVRVNAKDLRAKVIAEGANLGCTQLARIEFDRLCHGHINTDAIDNSAGVSCSDREVNIKILFNAILQSKKITLPERNKLLEKMTPDVSRLVLRDNYLQPQTITDINVLGSRNFDQQIHLIRQLEQEGVLDRQVEYLPDDTTLEEYQATQTCLTRPEVSVLMGYSKINIYDKILETNLPDDPFFIKYLRLYFPPLLQEKYDEEILHHPLRREIIATYAVNQLINRMGASYINEAMSVTGAFIEDIFKAFFTVSEVFDIQHVWDEIEKLDNKIDSTIQTNARLDVYKIVRRITLWLLRYYPMADTIEETASILQIGIDSFLSNITECLQGDLRRKLDDSIKAYEHLKLPKDLAKRLALLQSASTSPDIILVATETGNTVPEVAELYFKVGQSFFFSPLRDTIETAAMATTLWDRRLVASLIEDLYNYQSDLTINMLLYAKEQRIQTNDHFEALLESWMQAHQNQIINIEHAIKESQIETALDLTAATVIVRELRHLSGN